MRLLQVFARAYPRQTAFLVGCLILAGLAEGIGLSSLLPLIGFIARSDEPASSSLSDMEEAVLDGLRTLGFDPTLGVLLGFVVVAVVVKALLVLLANKQVGYAVAHMSTDLRLRLIRALLRTRWEYYVHQRVGTFANAVASEAQRASQAYLRATVIFSLLVQAAVYAGVAVLVSWQATLVAMVWGTLIVAMLARLIRMARRAGIRQTKLAKSLLGRLTDTLSAVKPLKAMGREMLIGPMLEGETRQLNRAVQRDVLSKTALDALYEPLIIAFLAVGLYGAVTRFALRPDIVIMLALLCARIVERLGRVQKEYQRMVTCESAFWSLRDMIEGAEAAEEESSGSVVPTLTREVTLDHVSFAYDDHLVLQDASLTLFAGDLTVIVGPSGAGKTTIADLIIGLVQPQRGEVCSDGVPLPVLDARRWRSMIGYVPQEGFLLHETVYNNVALGDPDLTLADVQAALHAAGAWDFVTALPAGVETVIGERGMRVSGGQRQRIALARALVRKPTLLILDEATSALDPTTERAICATLERHRGRLTILAICHHGALVELADHLYRVEDGGITPVPTRPVHPQRAVAPKA